MRFKQHIRKQLNLNFYICKWYKNKMLLKTKNKLASNCVTSPQKKKNAHSKEQSPKNFQFQFVDNQELGTNRLFKGVNRDNMPRMCDTSGNARKKQRGRIIGKPIIELEVKKEIMDIDIYSIYLMKNSK